MIYKAPPSIPVTLVRTTLPTAQHAKHEDKDVKGVSMIYKAPPSIPVTLVRTTLPTALHTKPEDKDVKGVLIIRVYIAHR